MAWLSKDARDVPPDDYKHICHRNRYIKIVTCILCDGGFCKSEIIRRVEIGKGFFISQHLVVCPAHPDITFDIFDNIDENSDIEKQILKRKTIVIQKHLGNIEKGLNATLDIESDFMDVADNDDDTASIASSCRSKKCKVEFNTECECEFCQEYLKELSFEKKMNSELSKHNDELRNYNDFEAKPSILTLSFYTYTYYALSSTRRVNFCER